MIATCLYPLVADDLCPAALPEAFCFSDQGRDSNDDLVALEDPEDEEDEEDDDYADDDYEDDDDDDDDDEDDDDDDFDDDEDDEDDEDAFGVRVHIANGLIVQGNHRAIVAGIARCS